MTSAIIAPKAAWSLARLAGLNGWRCRLSVARGPWRGRAHDSAVLRAERGDELAVAQWLDGKAETAYSWSARRDGVVVPERVAFAELRRRIASDGPVSRPGTLTSGGEG